MKNDHSVIVNGVDLMERFGLILNVKDSEFNPPEMRSNYLEIPGMDGVLDLTESLSDDTNYEDRKDTMIFGVMYPDDFSQIRTKVMNFLHGRRYEYQLSWEPGYTYTGRFAVDTHYSFLHYGEIKVNVDANPWRRADPFHLEVPAANGVTIHLPNRRRRVSPTVDVKARTIIGYKNQSWNLPSGVYTLNDLLLDPGDNVVFIDSRPYGGVNTWNDVLSKLGQSLTWDQIKEMRWAELAKYGHKLQDDPLSIVNIDYDTYDL